jgi:streptogramin lyase
VKETGGSGHVQLTVNGTLAGSTATLAQSSQSLGVSYDGGGAAGYYATITLSASGAASESFEVVPLFVTSASPLYSNGAIAFTAPSQALSMTATEAVPSGQTYTATVKTGCHAAVSPATGSGASYPFSVTSGPAAETSCTVTVADSLGASIAIPYSEQGTSGGITIGGIQEYHTPVNSPNTIVSGADGNVYVSATQSNAGTLTGSTVWVYNTSGSEVAWSAALTNDPVSIAAGPDGKLWFVGNSNSVYTYTTNGDVVSSYAPAGASSLAAITVGPDGNLWMVDSGNGNVYDVSPSFGTVATYNIAGSPTLIAASSSAVYAIVPGATSTLYRLTVGGGQTSSTIPGTNIGPAAMTVDPAGNVWVAEANTSSIDEYVPGTGWTQHPIQQNDGPLGIVVGGDGNIWFTAPHSNSIGALNITSGTFAHFAIPTSGASPAGITLGSDGRIWFTESAQIQIGAITP